MGIFIAIFIYVDDMIITGNDDGAILDLKQYLQTNFLGHKCTPDIFERMQHIIMASWEAYLSHNH